MRVENTLYLMSHSSPSLVRDLTSINISIIFSNVILLLIKSFFAFDNKTQHADGTVTHVNEEMDSLKIEFARMQKSHRQWEENLDKIQHDVDTFSTDLNAFRARFNTFSPPILVASSD